MILSEEKNQEANKQKYKIIMYLEGKIQAQKCIAVYTKVKKKIVK